ncbi:MAG TPA: OmpA family protein [Flavobacteriales bacterium]|nr:OmpA family protein [Flavobacteriales bacterium]
MFTSVHRSFKVLLCAALLGFAAPGAIAQIELRSDHNSDDIMVEGVRDDDPSPLFRALWHHTNGAMQFELQPLSSDVDGLSVTLDRLMEAGMAAYLDAHVRYTREGVKGDANAESMGADLDAMTRAALEGTGSAVAFAGLSGPTRQQLDRLLHIDWSKATGAVNAGSDQDKYLAIHFYLRGQRDELVRQLRADLLPLADVELFDTEEASPGNTERVNTTCGTVFDDQNFLCALDLQLADTGGGAMDPELGAKLLERMGAVAKEDPAQPTMRIRKRDRWLKAELDAINERIDGMDQRKELWQLRDRMENMEDRLALVELDIQEVKDNTAGLRSDYDDNPLANLSELTRSNLVVRFERYSVTLGPSEQVMLNEVFEQLARSATDKVLITGYSDHSGDSDSNLRLSERRAKAVRAYLMQRGIDGDRLLVNFYGDSKSMGRDPSERRVEIEWLR